MIAIPDYQGKEEERERVEGDPVVGIRLEAIPEDIHLVLEGRPLVHEEVLGTRVQEGARVDHCLRSHRVVRIHLKSSAVHWCWNGDRAQLIRQGLVQFFHGWAGTKNSANCRMSGKYVPLHLRGKKLTAVEVKPGVRFPSNATGEESANLRYKKAPTSYRNNDVPPSVKYGAMSRKLGTRKLRAKPVKGALKRGKTAKLQRHSAEKAASKKKTSGPRSAPK